MTSIFDCDTVDEPQRQQIIYDEDIFEFGNNLPEDQSDNVISQKVSINRPVTNDDKIRKNGKRKAYNNEEYGKRKVFKVNITNAKTLKVVANGDCRRVIQASANDSSFEEYELIKKIGKGTYGDVFKAKWTGSCGETIAIKRLTCQLDVPNMETNIAFFKREYDNLCAMKDCKNIVKLLKGREDRISNRELRIDLLFEYCPHDLRKIIQNKRIIFQFSEIKTFLRQIFVGLDYMHSRMLMHRDIKTENILLTADGVVKIADFGLSRKLIDPDDQLDKHVYTPNLVTQWYRAPEILLGDYQYNESIDIWSVGCVMGEFWYRQPILQGQNEIQQIKLISKLCGTLSPVTWPNIINLRMFQQLGNLPTDERKTRTFLKYKAPILAHNQANDFFDKILQINPDNRLTSRKALCDDIFYTAPLPVKSLKPFMLRILPILFSTVQSTVSDHIFDHVY